MKRKNALALGLICLALLVVAIALVPVIKPYVGRLLAGKPPYTIEPTIPPATATKLALSSHPPTDGYGIYDSCSPKDEQACFAHLDNMATAGFKLVINYDQLYGDANFQKAYLAHARSVGMKVIVSFSNPAFYDGRDLRTVFPALAQACACSNNHDFIAYAVNLVKNDPAVWGYYIGDEVDPSNHDKMKQRLADVVHQVDPAHPRLFIDTPGHQVGVWHGNSPFYDTAEVIGSDFYPIRDYTSGYPNIEKTTDVVTGVQQYANEHHESSAIVLQAFSYNNYGDSGIPYPTAQQMNYMLAQTLVNSSPRVVLWYSYYDTMSSGSTSTEHWNTLKSIITTSEARK